MCFVRSDFSFTSMAFDGSKMPSNSFSFLFLFFFALLFVLMNCMRVNRWLACMYVPVFLFEIGNQGIFFHHFGIRFKVLLLLAACCSLFLLQFIIIIVVINLQCVFIRIFYSFSCIFSFVSLLSLSLLFYYHPLFFSLFFLFMSSQFLDSSIEIIFVWNFVCLFVCVYILHIILELI